MSLTMPTQVAEPTIIDVWRYNMDEQFAEMRETLEKYPYVAMVRVLPFYHIISILVIVVIIIITIIIIIIINYLLTTIFHAGSI